jgi:hypothetical protein
MPPTPRPRARKRAKPPPPIALATAQRLDQAPRALGSIQDRGDPDVAPSGECPASAGRPSSSVLGRPRPNQRAGPASAHDLSPASVRHSWHAPALARRPDHTTMDHQTPTVRASPHLPTAAQGALLHLAKPGQARPVDPRVGQIARTSSSKAATTRKVIGSSTPSS